MPPHLPPPVEAPVRAERLAGARRRGSLIVTSFMMVVGMMVVVGGINAMLKNQIETSLTIQKISFARLQTLYVAEMGVNQLMYTANTAASLANIATNGYDPFSTVISTTSGSKVTMDYTNNVALTRGVAGASATVTITRGAGMNFTVLGTVVSPGTGTFNRTLTFGATLSSSKYRMASFAVAP